MKNLKIDPAYFNVLSSFLQKKEGQLSIHPNGQNMYSFPNGLVVNVYESTGSVTFQGKIQQTKQLQEDITSCINGMKI